MKKGFQFETPSSFITSLKLKTVIYLLVEIA